MQIFPNQKTSEARRQWLMLVILATQDIEIDLKPARANSL
jgi:hypothetical protein